MNDSQYIESVSKDASTVLSRLFESAPPSTNHLESLDVLVIGSGFFPSFLSLVNSIAATSRNLKKINFTLVEPLTSETNRFEQYFVNHQASNATNLSITYSIQNMDIKYYLKNVCDLTFDIIYFEQPDLSPIGIVLAKSGIARSRLELSLRESIPYLKRVVKSQSILIASFLYKKDLKQLNSLIKYSMNLPTRLVVNTENRKDGTPYNSGLIAIVDSKCIKKSNPEILAESIKRQDTYYSLFLVLSFLIFAITPPIAKGLSALGTLSLFLYHRYGVGSMIIKIAIIAVQIIVFACAYFFVSI